MLTIEAKFIESFVLLNKFFQKNKVRYCLVGGIAAGYWGEPRYTHAMDFTVVSQTHNLKNLTILLKQHGFRVNALGSSQIQVIQKNQLSFQADIILAETEYQGWVVQRATQVRTFTTHVPICSAEDLIILKLITNRRQDLLDIENILKKNATSLDKKYLKEWLEFWDLIERFDKEFGQDYPHITS